MALIHEISITEIKGLSMGHAQDQEAKTGVTVLLFEKDRGAVTGCDISGGGPASRETAYLAGDSGQSAECHRTVWRIRLWTGSIRWSHALSGRSWYWI